MTRYFYRDPLAAAWQAKYFGMRFQWQIDWSEPLIDITQADVLDSIYETDPRLCHVHPDSLHLLEPQAGDAVEFDRWHWDRQRHDDMKDAPYKPHYGSVIQCNKGEWLEVVSAGVGWDSTLGGHRFAMQHKVILRNGIAFHWPEADHG